MASRCQFEGSNDVGVFANLTNAYAITALGAAENFHGARLPWKATDRCLQTCRCTKLAALPPRALPTHHPPAPSPAPLHHPPRSRV